MSKPTPLRGGQEYFLEFEAPSEAGFVVPVVEPFLTNDLNVLDGVGERTSARGTWEPVSIRHSDISFFLTIQGMPKRYK